jgi:hypothetical protein
MNANTATPAHVRTSEEVRAAISAGGTVTLLRRITNPMIGAKITLSFHKERIPPFTAGVNPTLADQSTDDTLAGYSTVIHNY